MPEAPCCAEQHADGRLVWRVPPMSGWRRDEAVALFVSALVCLAAGLKTVQYLPDLHADALRTGLLILLWWLGLVSMVLAVDDRTRHWRIELGRDHLLIERDGLLGRRCYHWLRDPDLRVSPPDSPGATPSLTILGAQSPVCVLPIGRNLPEAQAIAQQISQALR